MFNFSETINNHFLLIAFFGLILTFSERGFYYGLTTFLIFVVIALINVYFVKVVYQNNPSGKDRKLEFGLISTLAAVWLLLMLLPILSSGYAYMNKLSVTSRAAKGEAVYQKCLDSIARNRANHSYFKDWIAAGRPNYDMRRGHWEWAFMKWLMEKHPESCDVYDIDRINDFLKNK